MGMRSFILGRDPDGPVEEVEVDVSEELLEHLPVAGVVRQVLVELGSDGPDLPQVVPGRVGEVVVLQVVPQVQVEEVPDADVVVGLLPLDELVVLGDDVDGCGVRPDRAQPRHEEEEQCPGPPEMVDGHVGEGDEEVVEGLVATQAGVLHEHRTQRVEQLDDRVEDVLVPAELGRQLGLPDQREVGVAVDLAEEVVVVGVVAAEGDGGGDGHGDVAEHCHHLVDGHVLVAAEVDEVVDAAVEAVVEESADEVGVEEQHPDVLVLRGVGSTLAQQPLAIMRRMSASVMRMVQGLSAMRSWATCGYLVRIILRRRRCDSRPLTYVQSCRTPLLWSYMCSSVTPGRFRLVRQFTGVYTGSASLLFTILLYNEQNSKQAKELYCYDSPQLTERSPQPKNVALLAEQLDGFLLAGLEGFGDIYNMLNYKLNRVKQIL